MTEPKDPSKKHMYISFLKSAIRISGCVFAILTMNWMWLAGSFLFAELLGVAEEL